MHDQEVQKKTNLCEEEEEREPRNLDVEFLFKASSLTSSFGRQTTPTAHLFCSHGHLGRGFLPRRNCSSA
jgi:hypothetical protein